MILNKPDTELQADHCMIDGEPCYRVPLSGRDGEGRHAILDEVGLGRLRDAGARALYLVTDGGGRVYVTLIVPPRGRAKTAARVVAAAPDRRCVTYVGHNRLDLRLSNLQLRDGFAPGEAHAVATEAARRANQRVERPSEIARRPTRVSVQPQLAA